FNVTGVQTCALPILASFTVVVHASAYLSNARAAGSVGRFPLLFRKSGIENLVSPARDDMSPRIAAVTSMPLRRLIGVQIAPFANFSLPCASTVTVAPSRDKPVTGPVNTGAYTYRPSSSTCTPYDTRNMRSAYSAPESGESVSKFSEWFGSRNVNDNARVISASPSTVT